MGRRYQEIQSKTERDLDDAKTVLKRLPDPSRAQIIRWLLKFYRWLLKFYEDDGGMKSPQAGKRRRRVTIDGQEFLLVAVVKRKV